MKKLLFKMLKDFKLNWKESTDSRKILSKFLFIDKNAFLIKQIRSFILRKDS
jgi:hypothetical protein